MPIDSDSVVARYPVDGPLAVGCEPECPGCAHRRMPRAESERRKMAWLSEVLAPWADRLGPVRGVGDENRWRYRDKAVLHAEWDGGRWRLGLRRRDRVIAIPECPVHSERVNVMARGLTRILPPADVFPLKYYVQSGAQAVLVLKAASLPGTDWLVPLDHVLSAAGSEGLWLHLNPSAGRRIFAKNTWRLLRGEPRSRDEHGLWYGPAAFQQLLPVLHGESLDDAQRHLDPGERDAVVDLYCGVGSSLLRWERAGASTIGVEWSGEALACARLNAPRAMLLRGACAQRLPQLTAWVAQFPASKRLLYANPPRTGLEPEVLDWICNCCKPRRLAYLSCSAGTLRRDLVALENAGFSVQEIAPYDFFPQTLHVECLTLLERTAGGA